MAKKTITIGSHEFKVDLHELQDAIGIVQRESASLRADEQTLLGYFAQIEAAWQTPAGKTFVPLKEQFSVSFTYLLNVLEQMIHRMQTTYHNYLVTEEQNAKNVGNLNHHGGNGGNGGHHSGHHGTGNPASHHPGHHPSHHGPGDPGSRQPGHHGAGDHHPGDHDHGGHRPDHDGRVPDHEDHRHDHDRHQPDHDDHRTDHDGREPDHDDSEHFLTRSSPDGQS
ncbi:MAG TPA: WXG100 family type VII secretion target, partial [Pseudonocardiaceae bacterium]